MSHVDSHPILPHAIILNPDSPEFRAAIRPVCDEQSWIYGMSRSECEYIITQGAKAAIKSLEES